MNKFFSVDNFKANSKVFATVGTFDGCHLGHKFLFKDLKSFADKHNAQTLVFTFWPHPRSILSPDFDFKLLNTMEEKIELFDDCGIDNLVIEKFNQDFSRISPLHFIRDILINKLKIEGLIIGYNHHFGRNREGSYEDLKDYAETYDFNLCRSKAFKHKEESVSSTKIRNMISNGNVFEANKLLGYNYFFSGLVVRGDGIGRRLKYPTANILVKDEIKLIPENGVYAVKVIFNENEYLGMMNIGYRPTLNLKDFSIEVNLFDFKGDLYGQKVRVFVISKIREEVKFECLDTLKKQISNDKTKIVNFFKKYK